MYCRKCGNEINEGAKFCSKCGSSTISSEQTVANESKVASVDNKTIKYSLKPTFNIGYKLFTTFWKTILVLAIFLLYLSEELIEINEFYKLYGYSSKMISMITILGLGILIYIVIKLILEKKQYDNLQYNFYANKLEYIDGFINKEEKELKYKNIREVTMTQGIIERMFKIGTIKIFTNASSGMYNNGNNHSGMNGRNGIVIHCVTDVKEQYKKIKEIIDEGTQE